MAGVAYFPLWTLAYLLPVVLLSGAAAYPVLRRFGGTTWGTGLGFLVGGTAAFGYGNFYYLVLARLWESPPDPPPEGGRPEGYVWWFVPCVFGFGSIAFALAGWMAVFAVIAVGQWCRRSCGYAPRVDTGTDS